MLEHEIHLHGRRWPFEGGTWVSVRDLAGSGHPSPADAIRLIDAGLLVGERRADGQVWVNERALLEAAAAHGQRLRDEESSRLAGQRRDQEPVTPRRPYRQGPPRPDHVLAPPAGDVGPSPHGQTRRSPVLGTALANPVVPARAPAGTPRTRPSPFTARSTW